MRRSDREITDKTIIDEIFNECTCCRVGFYDNGEIYIIPLNYGYSETSGKYILYFHGATEGRKINLIKKNPTVGFEIDDSGEITGGKTPCSYSAKYKSIIGTGVISFVEDANEKIFGLNSIMKHYTGKNCWCFESDALSFVKVFRLTIDKLSCKIH